MGVPHQNPKVYVDDVMTMTRILSNLMHGLKYIFPTVCALLKYADKIVFFFDTGKIPLRGEY